MGHRLPLHVLCVLLLCAPARAEGPTPDVSEELRIIESTERDEDPLAIDESTGRGLDEAARALPKPQPFLAPPVQGPVLGGLEQVAEERHEVEVTLAQGLAFVALSARFVSRSPRASELSYRLALPRGAVVTGVRLCGAPGSCREAVPRAESELPSAREGGARPFVWARPIDDARGHALSLLLSSVARDAPLTLHVSYVAEAPVRGGRVRFTLPARGEDGRLARTVLRPHTRYPGASLPAELGAEPFVPIELVASLREGARPVSARETAPCKPRRCLRSFTASPRAAMSARPIWLLIDASPSMEGPPRGRVDVVLAALLALLPPETPVHAFAFAQRAADLGQQRADAAPLTPWSDAQLMDLGPASRPSSVLALAERELARERPRVLVLSDGLLDGSVREQKGLAAMQRAGAEPWLVNLGDGAQPPPGFSRVLNLANLADESLRSGELDALSDGLRTVASAPRAGEQRVDEGPRPLAAPRTAGAPWLAHWAARDRPAPTFASEGARTLDAAQLAPFASSPAPPAVADTGMPAESVLVMLRTQLVPRARACLRSDRKGRADYAVALTFHALFARREIAEARVEGAIEPELRRCLEAALDGLRVPAFSGRIRVRYPIHTEREAPPPVIALEPEVDARIERLLGPRGRASVPVVQ